MGDYFQQTVQGFDIRLEKSTKNVPRDDKYHIIKMDKIIYSTKILKRAQMKFNSLLKELGYKPNVKEELAAEDIRRVLHKQRLDNFFQSYDNYWNNSYKFRKGGLLNKR